MSLATSLKDRVAKLASTTHATVFTLTNGRLLGRVGGMPAVKLTTPGRKSGKPRTTMLTSPLQLDDGSVVLVASYGGDPRHPAWYLNLRDDPEVELVMGGERFTAAARTATDAERAELWPKVTSAYRGYAGYQKRTDREIPLVICERA